MVRSTVAVHRMSYLMKRYCLEKDDKVLLVTLTKPCVTISSTFMTRLIT